MPLPKPNLDTRRWADLVEEAQGLLPRYAPAWTDYNAHDPGITLIELFAYLTESELYRVNRIPERNRRKFLALLGFSPTPPVPARTTLSFKLKPSAAEQVLPAGLALIKGDERIPFSTLYTLAVSSASIMSVQTFDGSQFINLTRPFRDGIPFFALGKDPASAVSSGRQPALLLGFDHPLSVGKTVSLWFSFAGANSGWEERQHITDFAAELQKNCGSEHPGLRVPSEPETQVVEAQQMPQVPPVAQPPQVPLMQMLESPQASQMPVESGLGLPGRPVPVTQVGTIVSKTQQHHSVRLRWEYYEGPEWRPLDPDTGAVRDETRGFTLNGVVRFTVPGAMGKTALGADARPLFYVRCTLEQGIPEAAPQIRQILMNAVEAEQTIPLMDTLPIKKGASCPAGDALKPGTSAPLQMSLDDSGNITALSVASGFPESLVLDYLPATASKEGSLTLTAAFLGKGTGLPNQQFRIPGAPVANGRLNLRTIQGNTLRHWQVVHDLDSSKRTDADYTLDATTGQITFGDGEHGRVLPDGAFVLASCDLSLGAAGNVAAGPGWRVEEGAISKALLNPATVATINDVLDSVSSEDMVVSGSDEETVDHTAYRAVEVLNDHERLLGLCPPGAATLDGLGKETVLAVRAPQRAATLLDFERLALGVPGTQIARARAWAGMDPAYPGLNAAGTVTVCVIPFLPLGRPQPGKGLLQLVRQFLHVRKVIGTRLVVVGPSYITVTVQAQVQARSGADKQRVAQDIVMALNAFLHPLTGGPDGMGWPFGRDVYRSELLQLIDKVLGVDHVLQLILASDQGEVGCGNLCVGPVSLVTSGVHTIEVK